LTRVIPRQWIDLKTGELTMAAIQYLNSLENGDGDTAGIGTILAGVNRAEAKVDGVIDGTQVLASVTTTDAGNIPTALTALGTASGAAADVSLNRYSITNSAPLLGAGSASSQSVTATASFGTGPWTYAWAYFSGDTLDTIGSPAAATTTFTTALGDGNRADAIYRVTATDSLLATATADVAITLISTPVS
jgi:hypothetical protein